MAKYSTYETDRVAQNLFNSFIPPAWFPRPQNPDRHVDYFVETNIGDKPSGLIFGVQLRGRNDLKYSKCYVKYCIETRHLKYYIDQAKQPIFLILADTQTEQLYWLFTQQHIRQTLADKDWRNQKSITLFIPKIQKLDAVQPFLRAIEEADRYMRDLWPSSISAAIDHEKNRIEALDPRASIRVLSDGNKTVYEVQPKHGQILNFQLKIRVKPEKWQKILDWWERGEDLELDVGEFSVTNLPLINEIEQSSCFLKLKEKKVLI